MKIKEFQAELSKKNIDVAVFLNINFELDPNIFYFSGYKGAGLLAIPKNTEPFLIVSEMEAVKARKSRVKVVSKPKRDRLFKVLKSNLGKKKIKTIGLDTNVFSVAASKELRKHFKVKMKDVSEICYNMRKIKTKAEIKIIKEGCKLTDKIINEGIRKISKFKTESEVKAFLENEAKKNGCGLAFPTIVASGKNSSMAHHDTEAGKLNNGFCVIDFGIRYKGYCSDITRTIYLGKPSKKEIDTYNMLLDVQKRAISKIKPGVRCEELYLAVQKGLGKYAKYFTHGLGHGIGAKIHELPNLIPDTKEIIEKDMVFTVEPGIYLNDFGIRIEDDVLVTDSSYELLTKADKDLRIIKRGK